VSLTSVATDRSGLLLIAVFGFSPALLDRRKPRYPGLGSGWILTSIKRVRGFEVKYH
jgi:hypothetical protein